MIYPVYVCLGDETTAHGAEIPDIPGCFAASDEWDDLPAHMLDAFRLSMEGTAEEIMIHAKEFRNVNCKLCFH